MSENIIEVKNVSMQFNLNKERVDSLKEYMIKFVKKQLTYEEFWALKDISFSLKKGDSLGIIGLNGSGKSTLLKLIAGVMKPTTGSISTRGSMAPLIELGAGFDFDLTARENIFLNGAILGHPRTMMKENFDEIIDFSELYDFVDVPLKNFSSGMIARLGFAIATIINPEILIVDEILAVGDFKFQEKCEKRIREMIDLKATIIFVSHTLGQVEKVCKKALWLEHGRIKQIGIAKEVCANYKEMN